MSEELKLSVSQGYKDSWCFKLMVVKNESGWGYCIVSVWSSFCSTVGQEKVKIFWKWCLHRWQIPLSVQIRLSKTKQPLSQRKKTNFPRIQPFFLPPFPQLLVHCQLTTSSALTPSGSQKRLCLLLAVDSQPWLLYSCSEHYIPLLPALIPTFFLLPLQYHVLFEQKMQPLPKKSDSFTLKKLIASGVYSSQQHQAKSLFLMIQFQICLQFFCRSSFASLRSLNSEDFKSYSGILHPSPDFKPPRLKRLLLHSLLFFIM